MQGCGAGTNGGMGRLRAGAAPESTSTRSWPACRSPPGQGAGPCGPRPEPAPAPGQAQRRSWWPAYQTPNAGAQKAPDRALLQRVAAAHLGAAYWGRGAGDNEPRTTCTATPQPLMTGRNVPQASAASAAELVHHGWFRRGFRTRLEEVAAPTALPPPVGTPDPADAHHRRAGRQNACPTAGRWSRS